MYECLHVVPACLGVSVCLFVWSAYYVPVCPLGCHKPAVCVEQFFYRKLMTLKLFWMVVDCFLLEELKSLVSTFVIYHRYRLYEALLLIKVVIRAMGWQQWWKYFVEFLLELLMVQISDNG